jgi:ferredoxin
MPEKYHIKTKPMPPRLPRIGKCGIVDWREDCAGCHNCVKKKCVFDRYKQENKYISSLIDVDTLFNECMGCFSCVQSCTKGLLALSSNPVYERLGNKYWTPDILLTTWNQAETAKIPVSGGGYRGRFTGQGFDSMWTDMSEIVRPTRDGIHGREYISTAVDIGRKVPVLSFLENKTTTILPPIVDIPLPIIIDMPPAQYRLPKLFPIFQAAAAQTGIIMILDYGDYGLLGGDKEKYLNNIAFYLASGAPPPPKEILQKTSLVEISDNDMVDRRIKELKDLN